MSTSIYTDSYAVHIFIHLLLMANHEPKRFTHGGRVMNVDRGQHLTGRHKLSSALNMPIHLVRSRVKMLEDEGLIQVNSTNKFSIITVCNYNTYQERFKEKDQQETNRKPTGDQQEATNKNVLECKNDKNDKNNTPAQVQGQKQTVLTDLYLLLLEGKGIKYIPPKKDYIVFSQGFNRYKKKGATIPEVMELIRAWFEHDIGEWCGYKLANFWGDVGKVQLAGKPKLTKNQKAMKKIMEDTYDRRSRV